MIKIDLNENNIKISQKEPSSNLKEQAFPKEDEKIDNNNLNSNDKPNEDISKNFIKKNSNPIKNSEQNVIKMDSTINKVKTFNIEKRTDRFGNKIIHGGKQKVSFKNKLTEVVPVENLKEYNKMEENTNSKGNNCCFLI